MILITLSSGRKVLCKVAIVTHLDYGFLVETDEGQSFHLDEVAKIELSL